MEQEVGGSSPPNCTKTKSPGQYFNQQYEACGVAPVRYAGASVRQRPPLVRRPELLANLLPLTVSESVAYPCLTTLRRADRWNGWRVDRRYRRSRDRTNGGRTNRRQIDRTLAERLHMSVDTFANAFGICSSAVDCEEEKSTQHHANSTAHRNLPTSVLFPSRRGERSAFVAAATRRERVAQPKNSSEQLRCNRRAGEVDSIFANQRAAESQSECHRSDSLFCATCDGSQRSRRCRAMSSRNGTRALLIARSMLSTDSRRLMRTLACQLHHTRSLSTRGGGLGETWMLSRFE